ncbi:MAG: ABC transporter permease [Phycisphaerales bacterium]
MLRLVVSRLVQLPLIVGAVLFITFLLAWVAPGSPLDRPEGRRPPAEVIAAMEQQYNLDSPWRFLAGYVDSASGLRWARERFFGAAGSGKPAADAPAGVRATREVFDLGPSLMYRDRRVSEIIGDALPVSVILGLAAMVIAVILGVGAGVIGAVRPGSAADVATLALALVGISLPSFVVGSLLMLIFCVWLGWLPVAQWGPAGIVLPAVTLALPFAAYIARLTRIGMIEALGSSGPGGGGGADYIRTARAKGAGEARVVLRHALRNALLPVVSYLGPATAMAMTGSFVVERVFSVPGMGQHFVNAVLNKDLFLLLGVVLVYSTMLIVFNLAVDVMYRWVDPRIA